MDEKLQTLLLVLDELNEDEAAEQARQVYLQTYTERKTHTGRVGELRTHDEEPVVFYEDRFAHAFYRSADRVVRPFNKSLFDRSRAARVRWIKEVVTGGIEGTECWLIPPRRDTVHAGAAALPSRLYVLWNECYVVWLRPRTQGGWRFSTAYVATKSQIRRYFRSGRLLWRKKTPCD